MGLGVKGPQGPYVGPRLCCSLSLNFFLCEWEVQPHCHPHKERVLNFKACDSWGLSFPFASQFSELWLVCLKEGDPAPPQIMLVCYLW